MARSAPAPAVEDVLEALAATLASTASTSEALAVVGRAGPTSARLTRALQNRLRGGTLAAALTAEQLVSEREAAIVRAGEDAARLPAALRWIAAQRRTSRARQRAIRGAVVAPLALALVTLLTEPLPAVVVGAGSFGPAIVSTSLLIAATAALLFGGPRLLAHVRVGARIRAAAAAVPLARGLVRMETEERASSIVAAFADDRALALAPTVARAVLAPPYVAALTQAATDPFAPITTFSESFGLALVAGAQAGDLPARFSRHADAAARVTTGRLVAGARVAAYALVLAVFLHAALRLLAAPLPGLGGDIGNSPELRELEREIESAGH
ncbi:MAG TPA: type II secretion system F family protein [Polyangia bacterium]|jgi:hypothetical protein|nr:type II secretion system F family protein [Polyangia bacterium]